MRVELDAIVLVAEGRLRIGIQQLPAFALLDAAAAHGLRVGGDEQAARRLSNQPGPSLLGTLPSSALSIALAPISQMVCETTSPELAKPFAR